MHNWRTGLTFWNGLLLLLLFLAGYLIFSKRSRRCRKSPNQLKELITNRLNELVRASQVPFIVSVSAFETGGFRSPVLCENRNLFGMKLPIKRPTTAIGDLNRDGYAEYNTFEDSVTDFYLWQEYTNFPPYIFSLRQFVKNMAERNYFEAEFSVYLRGVSFWWNKLYIFTDEQKSI